MKLFFQICCVAMTLLFSGNVFAQSFEVPKNYVLKVAADYDQHEAAVRQAIQWLQQTPLDEQEEKRKAAVDFVLDWINGSPKVNVELFPVAAQFEDKNPGMLAMFMAFSAQYVLDHNFIDNKREKYKYAMAQLAVFYKEGKGVSMKKDKLLESYIQQASEGEADKWITKKFALKD